MKSDFKAVPNNRKQFEQIKNILDDAEIDADNFFGKGNKAAGKRLRAKMLQIAKLTKEVRSVVTDITNKL